MHTVLYRLIPLCALMIKALILKQICAYIGLHIHAHTHIHNTYYLSHIMLSHTHLHTHARMQRERQKHFPLTGYGSVKDVCCFKRYMFTYRKAARCHVLSIEFRLVSWCFEPSHPLGIISGQIKLQHYWLHWTRLEIAFVDFPSHFSTLLYMLLSHRVVFIYIPAQETQHPSTCLYPSNGNTYHQERLKRYLEQWPQFKF